MYQLEEIKKLLPTDFEEKILFWHSQLSNKEQFEAWETLRNDKKNIVIGTRDSVFLPFQKLENIIITAEQDENHKHWDQSPRYHTIDVAKVLSKIFDSQTVLSSFTPSVKSYFQISKGNYNLNNEIKSDLIFKNLKRESPTVIDISEERNNKNLNILSYTIKEKIKSEKPENIFLFINRRGYATTVRCNDCGHTENCPETGLPLLYIKEKNILKSAYTNFTKPIPLSCPKCRSLLIQLSGFGIEQLKEELEKENFTEHYDIEIIDSETKENSTKENKPKIIIGTQSAFKTLVWSEIALTVFIDSDRQLALPEYNSLENYWHMTQEVLYKKKDTSNFYIQTSNPEHYFFRSLAESDRFYRLELNFRQKLKYPPYSYLTRYFYGNFNQIEAKKIADKTFNLLKLQLTKEGKNAILSGPIEMHPRFFRGKYWYVILVKFDPKNWYKDLTYINNLIPSDWKADPNPNSILSP